MAFPPPTMHKTPQISTGINHQRNIANHTSSAGKTPNTFKANFANFDAANFEIKNGEFLALPKR